MLKVTFPCSVALTFFCASHARRQCIFLHLQPLCGETPNSGHQLAQVGRLAIMLAYNRSIPSGHRNCLLLGGILYCKFPFDGTEGFSTARCCFIVELLCLSATLTKLYAMINLDVFKSTNRRFTRGGIFNCSMPFQCLTSLPLRQVDQTPNNDQT